MTPAETGIEVAAVIGLSFALIAVVAIASLVTAATLSILAIYLQVIADSGTEEEREYAKMILKLRKRPYSMICAFVFTGSAMAELIPLIISLIIQEISQQTVTGNLNAISIIFAVGLVIIFVELLPLAYTVRKALFVSRFLIRFSEILLIIWYPLTYPINYTLDKIYEFRVYSNKSKGKLIRFANTEERFFRNEELAKFVELHIRPEDPAEDTEGGNTHRSVVEIMKGAFQLQKLKVRDVMLGWKSIRLNSQIFSMDSKVTVQDGLSLYGSGVDGALVIDVEDINDPQQKLDIDMIPMNGKKVKGFVHWSSFISDIQEEECRAKYLSREFMPIVYDCFEDLLALFSILHYGRCKMALVVITPPPTNTRGQDTMSPNPDYEVSTTKVYWSNQPHISAYVKPIGVVTYQSLLKVLFANLSHSTQMMPDPMDKFKLERLNTQEKLNLVDSLATSHANEAMEEAPESNTSHSTGIIDKVLSFGTRRRKGTLVNVKSPVTSSRASVFEIADGESKNKENEKEE
ncbi:hypothetical protein ABW19_dt0206942 [Dactylella cylindrospora]|nr:hypothetical protein ABW19_dt0206942 [Dactylella cylindrospora]